MAELVFFYYFFSKFIPFHRFFSLIKHQHQYAHYNDEILSIEHPGIGNDKSIEVYGGHKQVMEYFILAL